MRETQPGDTLIALNLKGAYTSPPVPDGFDADTASPAELARHGFYWSRPSDPRSPAAAVWRRLFSRRWRTQDRIVPQLMVQPGRSHRLGTLRRRNGDTDGPATSNNWAGCILPNLPGAPAADEGSALAGYPTVLFNQQHVIYVGTDHDIHELCFSFDWIYNDLTHLAAAPAVAPGSRLTGYETPFNNQQHVDFIGADGHVHELFFDGQWHHNDLTQLAGAPAATAAGGLVGYATLWNSQQHVDFIGTDAHVHELWFDGRWHHDDLTHLAAGAPNAAAGRALAGYVSSPNQQHVDFIGTDGHVHELFFDGQWHHNDLTGLAPGAPAAAAGAALAGYVTPWNNQQHVDFIGTDRHAHELWFDGRWQHNDLTRLAPGTPDADAGSALAAYPTFWNDQQHVDFVGADSHVHELFFDGQWHHNDLTRLAKGVPDATAGSPLDGYVTPSPALAFPLGTPRQQHVNFIGTDSHVHELWFDTQWHHNDLTQIAGTPWATAIGSWNIPAVSQPNQPQGTGTGGWDSSSWVGIDGRGSNDVLQAGIQQAVNGDGVPSYVAWYEWFAPGQFGSPGYINQVNIPNFPVAPGHTVHCVAQYVANKTKGALIFINETTGQHFSLTLDPPPGADFAGNSIEWIMEAPNGGEPKAALPQFAPVVFSPAYGFDTGNKLGTPQNGYPIDIALNGVLLTAVAIDAESVAINFVAWHTNDLTAITKAPAAMPGSRLVGYATAFNLQQHVNYAGTDNHVHELWFDGHWHYNDLSQLAAAPSAATLGPLAGYVTTVNSQMHVDFTGLADNHVHELYYDGAWHHNDLTQIARAPLIATGSGLAGYETAFNRQQHVDFAGTDGHVHELYYDGAWHHNDLSGLAGAPVLAGRGGLDGYVTGFNGQQHVDFVGADNHVHELYYDGVWHHNDLTRLAGAPAAAPGSALDGYVSGFNGQQHVNFVGADNHVHELYYDGAWHHNDLTQLAGAPAAAPGSALDGYVSAPSQQHVNFVGADNHVHELFYDGAWHHNDLTQLAAAPATAANGALDGYLTAPNQQHVDFVGADQHVHELYY